MSKPVRTGLLRDKNPGFIQITRIEGNVSIASHSDVSHFGNGSLEVDGTLSTDAIKSATQNSVIQVGSPLNFEQRNSDPALPVEGQTQIFADGRKGGRIVMVSPNGFIADLNPLNNKGDLMTCTSNGTVRLPLGSNGQILMVDTESITGLKWGTGGTSTFDFKYNIATDEEEMQTTSTDFSLRLAIVTVDLPEGTYRIGISFEWDMSQPNVGFESDLSLDDVSLNKYQSIPVVVGTFHNNCFFVTAYFTAGSHTVSFNTRVFDQTRALSTRNVRLELWKVI